jgi:nucleolar protein 9
MPSFVHLVQHRFASHCCEALFIKAAPVVTQEVTKPDLVTPPSSDPNDVIASMENLFLFTLDELEGYLGYLITERFASHVLRVLLVVLSGTSLERQGNKSTLHSKKKEKVVVPVAEKQDLVLGERKVPQSFTDALQKVINDSVANLDTNYLQMLATHPTGNPTLQLMLKLELTLFGKVKAKDENSIIRKLLPDDPIKEDTGCWKPSSIMLPENCSSLSTDNFSCRAWAVSRGMRLLGTLPAGSSNALARTTSRKLAARSSSRYRTWSSATEQPSSKL